MLVNDGSESDVERIARGDSPPRFVSDNVTESASTVTIV